jgi:hypothetical protein
VRSVFLLDGTTSSNAGTIIEGFSGLVPIGFYRDAVRYVFAFNQSGSIKTD